MRNHTIITGTILATLFAASVAYGQTPTEPAPPAAAPVATGGGGGGGGAGRGAGVGVQEDIGAGLVGGAGAVTAAAFVYDWGQFRVSGLFGMFSSSTGFGDERASDFGLGANFYYVLHAMRSADLSIGGGAMLVLLDQRNGGAAGGTTNHSDLGLSGGLQIRAFIVDNVALHANLGLGIALRSDDRGNAFTVTGNLLSGVGLTYFFR